MNLNVGTLSNGRTVEEAKNLLYERRMSPTSVAWPGGLNYPISW
jgi:hypothetical protein